MRLKLIPLVVLKHLLWRVFVKHFIVVLFVHGIEHLINSSGVLIRTLLEFKVVLRDFIVSLVELILLHFLVQLVEGYILVRIFIIGHIAIAPTSLRRRVSLAGLNSILMFLVNQMMGFVYVHLLASLYLALLRIALFYFL